MDENLQKLMNRDNNFELIGQDNQLVQLILSPGQNINVRPYNIIYQSPNIKVEEIYQSYLEKVSYFFSNKFHRNSNSYDRLSHQASNQSEKIGYLGLKKLSGKIFVINVNLFQNMLFREQNLLCYSSDIQVEYFYWTQNYNQSAWLLNTKQNLQKEQLVFLQSKGDVIEKQLADDEEILVKANFLIAYSKTISFQKPDLTNCPSFKYIIQNNMQKIKGPGTIFIENCSNQSNYVYKQSNNFLQLFIFIFLLSCIQILLEIYVLRNFDFLRFDL